MTKKAPWSSSYFLIPALNEEESLVGVIRSLGKAGVSPNQIVVIDNGSSDATPQLALQEGTFLAKEPQRGYGGACLKGVDLLLRSGITPEFLVFLDADGSDDPKDLVSFFSVFQEFPDTDFIIGSRVLGRAEPGSLSGLQIFGNRLTCTLIRIFYGKKFTDLGPFRILRWKAFLDLDLKDRTWGWNVEMQIKALRKGLTIREIPVHYRKRKGGKSKIGGNLIGGLRAGAKILWIFFRLTFFKI